MANTTSLSISAAATYYAKVVASLPNTSVADKTKVYIATNKLNDINYQASKASIKLPGSK
jgi:hypothetical protein